MLNVLYVLSVWVISYMCYVFGHIVHVADSFLCCESIRDLQKVKFSAKIFQGFWINFFFFAKILYLVGSVPFASTFSEI